MKTITAIILAAGESVRMKEPKLLLRYGGVTIIEKVLQNVKNSSINDYIVVLGAYSSEIIKATGEDISKYCFNENYKNGMLSSVKCGITHISGGTDAVMIILGDQPMAGTSVINEVAGCYRNNNDGIVIPVFEGKRGHPVVIDLKYRNDIINLEPGRGLKGLMEEKNDDIREISIRDGSILRDIDTPEDYIKETNHK